MNPIVLIPARMASTRLPGKPLADIAGKPMIVQVLERAREAGFARVAVACAEGEIAAAVEGSGGEAVLTDPNHPSGSDRIFEALRKLDAAGAHDVIVNVQGDLPTLEPEAVAAVADALAASGADMATLVAPCAEEDRDNPNVVKAVVAWDACGERGRALYFTRATAPWGEGELFHHIGIYAYRRAALERFVALPPSPLEKREKLEQLRALEAGMTIAVARVAGVPLGVDTPHDLEKARAALAAR
ncbi:MAG: 3-deoxy-manno-octulosonate cytidylyltransferase [Alphaproteobacteria bacterium]|nr:3-deoxy-manno-octulosonate cytidylyltransferase [Alphaproteobacteria bacterium]